MIRFITSMLAIASVGIAAAKPVTSNSEALHVAVSTIKRFMLTSNRIDCLALEEESKTKLYIEFSVHEKHNEQCGGDPQTGPRLFGLRVYIKSGKVTSDVYSIEGEFSVADHGLDTESAK